MTARSKRIFMIAGYILTILCAVYGEETVSIYVDIKNTRTVQKGTERLPFDSLQKAAAFLYRYHHENKSSSLSARIYICSDLYEEEAILFTIPVKIHGKNNPAIVFGDNAGFVVEHTEFELHDCRLMRHEASSEPRTVPLIYGAQSTLSLKGVSIQVQEGGEAVILRNASFFCMDSSFQSRQTASTVLIRAAHTVFHSSHSSFFAEGVSAMLFSFSSVDCVLADIAGTVVAEHVGRLGELYNSKIDLQRLIAEARTQDERLQPAAFSIDRTSVITAAVPEPQLHGFKQLQAEF